MSPDARERLAKERHRRLAAYNVGLAGVAVDAWAEDGDEGHMARAFSELAIIQCRCVAEALARTEFEGRARSVAYVMKNVYGSSARAVLAALTGLSHKRVSFWLRESSNWNGEDAVRLVLEGWK